MTSAVAAPGQVIGARYRLERRLHEGSPQQGSLWLGRDQLAADAPVALRQVGPQADQMALRERWARLQGVLHPQVPRFGAVVAEQDDLWLVRDWQSGRTYAELLAARSERQLVFGAGEVLLLLRQLLPVLVALHAQDLLHGDISPANLLRRDSDGLPVLLDFGLVRGTQGGNTGNSQEPFGATPGYAPPELSRGEPAQPWMDLYALGVVALVLLSGDPPHLLLDPVSMAWRWPAVLESEPALRAQLQRLLADDPSSRFAGAAQALQAVQTVPMPESTGPVPRADRTLVLVPPDASPPSPPPPPPVCEERVSEAGAGGDGSTPELPLQGEMPLAEDRAALEEAPSSGAAAADEQSDRPSAGVTAPPPPPATPPATPPPLSRRLDAREEAAEGGLWSVLIALVLSAVVGTTLGWWWLSRSRSVPAPGPDARLEQPASLPPAEVDQRQQLLARLRAMQIDRGWFLRLVDASLLAQYPERRGRLPSDSLEDAPLRKVWNELAEEWLARVEQLPMPIRRRLGSFNEGDWQSRRRGLEQQGLNSEVLGQLVTGSARNLLPGQTGDSIPAEPYRQLWFAAAEVILGNVRIAPIEAPARVTQVINADVPAGGARLFPIRLPVGHALVLGVTGTPLLQMSVFAADGTLLEARGPLRVVSLGAQQSSPVQLLVTNDGVAASMIRLQLRADPPLAAPQGSEPAPPTRLVPLNPGEAGTPSQAEPSSGSPAAAPADPAAPVETPAQEPATR
ncbi:MAG: protein kinase [Synechococcaceae cyanobacterium]|nr:protein kinase [Synechococcaceae cyanobacterium]